MEDDDKRVMMTMAEKRVYILSKSMEYFGMTKDDLMPRKRTKSYRYSMAKKVIAYVLFKHTDMNNAVIADTLGYADRSILSHSFANIEEQLSDGIYADEKLKTVCNGLLSYLQLQ